jgi:hypothetical protein
VEAAKHSDAAGLGRAGRFSVADLEANQAGRMTFGQRMRVFRGSMLAVFISFIGLVISIALGPNLPEAYRTDVILGLVVTAFFLMCLLMCLGCAYAAFADMLDVVLGRARSVVGPIKVSSENASTYTIASPLAVKYGGQYNYRLDVGDQTFTISPELADMLSNQAGALRLYFGAYSDELLSLEPVALDTER